MHSLRTAFLGLFLAVTLTPAQATEFKREIGDPYRCLDARAGEEQCARSLPEQRVAFKVGLSTNLAREQDPCLKRRL